MRCQSVGIAGAVLSTSGESSIFVTTAGASVTGPAQVRAVHKTVSSVRAVTPGFVERMEDNAVGTRTSWGSSSGAAPAPALAARAPVPGGCRRSRSVLPA